MARQRLGRGQGLTRLQIQILTLLASGRPRRAIASALGISMYQVDRHRADIQAYLDIWGVANLTRYAIRTGLVKLEGE